MSTLRSVSSSQSPSSPPTVVRDGVLRRQPTTQQIVHTVRAAEDVRHLSGIVAGPRRFGYAVIVLFVGGLGTWAATAPLAGGAMAPGVVAPEGSRKAVQHLEGGIVEELRIRDGDVVEAGQPLVVLASVQSKANYTMLRDRQRVLLIKLARLEAERVGATRVAAPPVLGTSDGEIETLVKSQQDILDARHERYVTRQQILQRKIEQLTEQMRGFAAQVSSAAQQSALIQRELAAKEHLMRRGHLPMPELLRLQRLEAEILGRKGEFSSAVARAEQQVGETRLELIGLDAERNDQVSAEMDKTRNELNEVLEQLKKSEDVLKRSIVRAPVSGSVVNLRIHTAGGVVQRGEVMLEIVPDHDKLMIEAQVNPTDIDSVHGGLPVFVNFTAYSTRNTPRISGKLLSVSADRLQESSNHRPYYLARIEVDRAELARLAPQVKLIPGMPADVLIVTEDRTMLDYILQPLRDALYRGLREA